MSDLAQILLLPPPTPPQRLPARERELAVNPDLQQQGDAARGRRFRFRPNESGEGNTDIATRRTDPQVALNRNGAVEDATAQASSRGRIRYASADSRGGASSAFLAQTFAQEQLGEGLHNPPFAAASAAYTRTAAFSARTGGGVSLSV